MSQHHIILDGANNVCKVFDYRNGALLFSCEARNATVCEGFGHYGACPPGDYQLGETVWGEPIDSEIPYGPSFTYLLDVHGLWAPWGRAGIGLHGGGTGSPKPFDPVWQGEWIITEGCWRFRNGDLGRLFGHKRGDLRITTVGDIVTVRQGAAV